MKCNQVRAFLSPYLDSELDPATTYEVSRHLEICSVCAQWVAAEGELEQGIRERLCRRLGDEEQFIERALSRLFTLRTRLATWWAAYAAAALIAILGLLAYRMRTDADTPALVPALVAMAAEDHRRYLAGELVPDVRTDDAAALPAFFDGKLAGETGSFPTGAGWQVEGARLCKFQGIPVGFVSLRFRGVPVSVVDVPAADAERALGLGLIAPYERCFELADGRGILRRTAFGFRAAFGDVDMARLEEAVVAAR